MNYEQQLREDERNLLVQMYNLQQRLAEVREELRGYAEFRARVRRYGGESLLDILEGRP